MNDTARDSIQITPADTNGLDDLFDAEVSEVVPATTREYQVAPPKESQVGPTEGVPVPEAAKLLGLSVKTVKDRLRKGTLAGFKQRDKFGERWLVSLDQNSLVVPGTTGEYQVAPTDEMALVLPGSPTEPLPVAPTKEPIPTPDLTALVELLEKKDRELQAASCQIGYLRAQLESKDEQIKLLTDSQHRQGWWAKFSSWFFRGR